ncbi:MAG: hypothetical protein IRY96_00405 [Burkholderiales bacterium]|nr:hypothetical protein [Burkholderiales bacterium]PZN02779.1 MAG: hypothetical protein DIU74_07195 [Pseudomonadota bacterium]
MKARIGLLLLLVLVLAAGAYWFFENYERRTERYFVGMSEAARRNPFLAAERTLARLGVEAHKTDGLSAAESLPAAGVVILTDARDGLTAQAQAALLAWVRAGGHLVTEDRAIGRGDALLDALGVKAVRGLGPQRRAVEIRLSPEGPAYKVEMHAMQSLQTNRPVLAAARHKGVTHMLHFRLGEGHVTVLNDLHFMTNAALGQHDHAEFLWALLHAGSGPGTVRFVHEIGRLSLWQWLREHAAAALAGSAVCLLLWLWRIVPRFGRAAADAAPERRSLLEHLNASGRFQWQSGAGAQLAECARRVLLQRLLRHEPVLRGLSVPALAAELKKRYALSDAEARCVVLGANVNGTAQFVAVIALYQRLHARLAGRSGENAT